MCLLWYIFIAQALSLRGSYAQHLQCKREISARPDLQGRKQSPMASTSNTATNGYCLPLSASSRTKNDCMSCPLVPQETAAGFTFWVVEAPCPRTEAAPFPVCQAVDLLETLRASHLQRFCAIWKHLKPKQLSSNLAWVDRNRHLKRLCRRWNRHHHTTCRATESAGQHDPQGNAMEHLEHGDW